MFILIIYQDIKRMVKKGLYLIGFVSLTLIIFFINGCDSLENDSNVYVTEIIVDFTTVDDNYVVGQFKPEDVIIIVKKNNQTQITVPLTLDMIQESDHPKLTQIGEHTLTIMYLNKTTTLTIVLVEASNATYRVTYELDGGTLVSGELIQTIMNGLTSSEPVCEKEGYVFKGWMYSSGVPFDPNSPITETTTIIAKWNKLHRVTFVNEVYELIEVQYVEDGLSATAPNVEKIGYLLTWDITFSDVRYDIMVKAIYTAQYSTILYDFITHTYTESALLGTDVELPKLQSDGLEVISWTCHTDDIEIGTYIIKQDPLLNASAMNITCSATWGDIIYTLEYHEVFDIFNANNEQLNDEYVIDLQQKSESFALTLTNKGRMFAWGLKHFSSPLGVKPMEIPLFWKSEDEHVVKIAAGNRYAYAITNKNEIYYYDHYDMDGYYKNAFKNITILFYLINNDQDQIKDIFFVNDTAYFVTEKLKIYGMGSNQYYAIDPLQEASLETIYLTEISSRFEVLKDGEYFTNITINHGGICGITNQNRIIFWNHIETTPIDITDRFTLESNEVIVGLSDDNIVFTSNDRLFYFIVIEDFFELIDLDFLNEGEEIISFADNRILTSHNRLIDLERNLYKDSIMFHDVSMISNPEEILMFNSHSFLTSNGRIFTWGNGNNTYRNGYAYPIEVSGEESELQDPYVEETYEQIGAILHENETVIDSIITSMDYIVLTSEHRVITGGFNMMSNFQGRFGDGTLNSRTYALDITENFHLSNTETIEGLFLKDTYYIGAYTSLSRVFTWGGRGVGTGEDFNDGYVNLPFDITPHFELEEGEVFVSYGKRLITSFNRIFEIYGPYVNYQENYKNLPFEIAKDISLQEGELFNQTIETDIITTSYGRVIFYTYNNNIDISAITKFQEGELIKTHLKPYDFFLYFFTTENQLFQYDIPTETWENINHLFYLEEDEVLVSFFGDGKNCYVITSNNRLFSWGQDNSGSIGNGEYYDQDTPIEITMYFDLMDGEFIETMMISKYIHPMQIVTSENRIFAWGYYSPYINLNTTPRPISYLESKVISTIELKEGEVINNPEFSYTDVVVDGYYNDINQYYPFIHKTMPPTDSVVYLKLKPKIG